MNKKGRLALSMLALVCGGVCAALGQGGTAFTYQGRLTDSGSPATGNYDLQFVLLDAASGGNALAGTNLAPVPVTGGLFTVTLDFGSTALDGSARWLQVTVRTNVSQLTKRVRNIHKVLRNVASSREELESFVQRITLSTTIFAYTVQHAAKQNTECIWIHVSHPSRRLVCTLNRLRESVHESLRYRVQCLRLPAFWVRVIMVVVTLKDDSFAGWTL